ncbi:S-adenosyl-L-methionine dependent methyltransferase, partial [Phlegmacium glaucopus]
MHSRNPYSNAPDFSTLAAEYQPLKEFLILDTSSRHRTTLDFRNEAAQRRLTEAIMFCHFGITLRIPENRLCPLSHRMDHRLNYILWIQDIVHAHDYVLGNPRWRVRGIDIGTGSTAIYPFLGCKLESEWEFVATELDDISYDCANENVSRNNMQSRIRLEKATREGSIFFTLERNPKLNPEFTMRSPPFYTSSEEVARLAPNAVCTGVDIEMIFADGGEEGFVGQMVEESERFHTQCKWYTSMLGKMSSVTTMVENLRKCSIVNYAITELVQGQTRRWAVGWSFIDMHLPD